MASSGLDKVAVTVDGEAAGDGAEVSIAALGDRSCDCEHVVELLVVDRAGNASGIRRLTARIDAQHPTAEVPRRPTVERGGTAWITFRVRDAKPCAPTAQAAMKIYDSRRLARSLPWRNCAIGSWETRSFSCRLAPGAYSVRVVARAGAENATVGAAEGTRFVRP